MLPGVDHLVVLTPDLATGVAWCERTLGIAPTAGGEHPLMGTHNRIFNISSPTHPRTHEPTWKSSLSIQELLPQSHQALAAGLIWIMPPCSSR
jgi:hypothetical protein